MDVSSESDRLIDILEAARIVRLSRSTLEQHVRRGLPFYDVAPAGSERRRLRFRVPELLEYFKRVAAA